MGLTQKTQSWLENQNTLYLALVVLVAGVVCVLVPHFVANSVGGSLIAASAISLLYYPMHAYERNTYALVKEWGLEGIYVSRAKMNGSTARQFKHTQQDLEYISFGLKSLRDSGKSKTIEDKVKKGMRVKILTLNPDSSYVAQREREEGGVPGEIKEQIKQLTAWMRRLYYFSPKPGSVEMKYYDAMPLEFYCRQDDRIYTGPYQYRRGSQQTISFEFRAGSEGYNYYLEYFQQLWNDPDFSHNVDLVSDWR